MGAVANKALAQCGLGFFVPIEGQWLQQSDFIDAVGAIIRCL